MRCDAHGALIAAAGAGAAATVPYFAAVIAWPEIVVPAYFSGRGGVLYDTIIFPHTPLLITVVAALGQLAGYSAILFRTMIAIVAAAGALLIIRSSGRGRASRLAGAVVGVPFYLAWLAATDSLAVWPDPMMAPLVLGAAVLLERFEQRNSRGALIAGALALGLCILVKQTAAWLVIAGGLWLVLASRRRSMRAMLTYAACAVAPYFVFVAGWALLYQTWSHVRWTLVVPLLSGHASEISRFVPEDFWRKAPLYFGTVAAALGARPSLRTPLSWIVAGAIGMAWPRGDLAHMAAAFAVSAVLVARGVAAGMTLARRSFRPAAAAVVVVLLVSVALWRAPWRIGGPVFFWNDRASVHFAAEVRKRVPPGGSFLNFNTRWETLYAITGTTTPSGLHVNPKFWYYLNKDDLDRALCIDLLNRPGTLILFTALDPRVEDMRATTTCLYQVVAAAPVVEPLGPGTSWRVIPRR